METVKKIDIHAHAALHHDMIPPHFKSRKGMIGPEYLLSVYDKLNIEKGVLLPITAAEAQSCLLTNEDTKIITEKYPDRFLWFCNVDPRMGNNDLKTDLVFYIEHYKKMGARGFGELTTHLYADDVKIEHLFEALTETDLPLTIHIAPYEGGCYGIIDEIGLPRLEKMLKKYPKVKVLGHSQPFWAEISGDLTPDVRLGYPEGKVTDGRLAYLMRECENLYCDLSATSGANAMMRDPDYCARFVEEFSDRILYGCDVCTDINVFQYKFDEFLTSMRADGSISEENYRKIVRENAIKLLKL